MLACFSLWIPIFWWGNQPQPPSCLSENHPVLWSWCPSFPELPPRWTIGPHWGWGKLNVPGLADAPPLGQPLLWHLWDLWVLASWTADPVLCPQWQERSHREFTRKVHNHKALPSKVPHIFHSGRPRAPSVRPAYLLLRPAYLRSPQGFMCVFSDPSAPILFLRYLLDGVWEKRDSSSC